MNHDKSDQISSQLSLLGERIRTIRKRLGMTQAELADGEITRNMLSRIENGIALPSLPTLCAICNKLDIPVGALFDDLDDYAVKRLSDTLKKLEGARKYSRAIEAYRASNIDKVPDYVKEMLCRIYIARAREFYEIGKLTDSLNLLSEAELLSDISENKLCRGNIFLLKTLIISSAASKETYTSETPSDSERLKQIIFDNNDMAIYLYCRMKLSDIAAMPYSQPHESAAPLRAELDPIIGSLSDGLFKAHIVAKLDMLGADYLAAKSKLTALVNSDMAPSMLYDIYSDIEFCSKCCGDFENAYKYSNLRIELLKKIN